MQNYNFLALHIQKFIGNIHFIYIRNQGLNNNEKKKDNLSLDKTNHYKYLKSNSSPFRGG